MANVRVIAASSQDPGQHKTVNILAAASSPGVKKHTQVTAAQSVPGLNATVKATAVFTPGFPSISIPGYSAPN